MFRYKVLKKQNNSGDCFVCGTRNDWGLRGRFYHCINPDGEAVLLSIFTPHDLHQSYANRMHGGIAGALLDESIGRALWVIPEREGDWGVTIELNTRYRKPTPLDQTLYIESKITSTNSRGFEGEGKLFTTDGTVCVTATARFLTASLENISGQSTMDPEHWHYIDEDLPEYIEI